MPSLPKSANIGMAAETGERITMADANSQALDFERALEAHGLKFDRIDVAEGDKPLVALNFGGGDFSYNHVRIHVFFDMDGESAQVVTSPIVSVPADKTAAVLLAVNSANTRFRWVKFYIDDDNDLIAEADAIISEPTGGEVLTELVGRTASIIDDVYADFMRAVWA